MRYMRPMRSTRSTRSSTRSTPTPPHAPPTPQVAAASGSGAVIFGQLVHREVSCGHLELWQDEPHSIAVLNVLEDRSEELQFKAGLTEMSVTLAVTPVVTAVVTPALTPSVTPAVTPIVTPTVAGVCH